MTYKIYTCASRTLDESLVNAHKKVIKHFNIEIEYIRDFAFWAQHPQILNDLINGCDADVVGFMDIDFIPFSKEAIIRDVNYVYDNDTFIGIAQPIPGSGYNQIGECNFPLPEFKQGNNKTVRMYQNVCTPYFLIKKTCYEKLGKPTFANTHRSDTGGEISYAAHVAGINYRLYYPTCFEKPFVNIDNLAINRLGNYGFYGVGTVYPNVGYHLVQVKSDINTELFIKRCDDVINNRFTTQGFYDCQDVDICKKLGVSDKQIDY
jgi:hypothetical protein